VTLIALEQARRANDGTWPPSPEGIEISEACPEDRWVYETSPDGGMTLAFSRDISWPELKGARLPPRFTVTP
jgi:hypothetical protein